MPNDRNDPPFDFVEGPCGACMDAGCDVCGRAPAIDPPFNFEDYVAELVAVDAALVERACEEALQGGECGVLVVYRDGRVVTARPDAAVPYGWRHEYR